MNKLSQCGLWLVSGSFLLPALVQAAPTGAPPVLPTGFTSTVTAPKAVKTGSPAAFSVKLTDKSKAFAGANVDLEVYDAKGKKVAQQVWSGQSLSKGKSSIYHWAWKPASAGTYQVKLGVFSADWKTLQYWVDQATVVKVS